MRSLGSRPRRPVEIAGRVALLATIAVVYPRMYFGFAFFDEAYYLAIPYSFLLGVRPFVDEPSIFQLASFFIQPFVQGYVAVSGSSSGLVLFGRHLYFITALVCVFILRRFWKRFTGPGAADALAALTLAFVPFCIFGLSYNTLTYLGLLAGSAFLCSACLPGRRARDMSLATFAFAVLSFAYPPMVVVAVPALTFAGLLIIRSCDREERTHVLVCAGTTAATCLLVGGGTLLWLGFPAALHDMLEFSDAQGAQGGSLMKWKSLGREATYQGWFLGVTATTIAGLGFALSRPRNARFTAIAAALAGPLFALASSFYRPLHAPFTTVPFVLSILGLFAPIALTVFRKHFSGNERSALAVLAGTSIAAGICVIWSTANGFRNAALGFTPAALVTLACVVAALTERAKPDVDSDFQNAPPSYAHVSALLLLCSVLSWQIHELWTHSYREHVPSQLGEWVQTGPWAGIRTTPAKSRFVRELANDIESVRGHARTILFYDYFPAGYLLTDLVPRAPGLWLFPTTRNMQGTPKLREVYAKRIETRDALPDLIVRLRCLPVLPFTKLSPSKNDPVDRVLGLDRYETAIKRECYSVSLRRDLAPRVQRHRNARARGGTPLRDKASKRG